MSKTVQDGAIVTIGC